jgi:2,4-didehydro-3-deoxy-L-rhamnonate hydrolase
VLTDADLGQGAKRVRTTTGLIARLSAVAALCPGDLIFTGPPGGIGATRTPPRFLADGDELVSTIEGLGSQRVIFRERDAK